MFDIICVTNRRQCKGDFLARIERIAAAHPAAIILREKDLTPGEYAGLLRKAMSICRSHSVDCVAHSYPEAAELTGCTALHMPLRALSAMPEGERRVFRTLGASCHSVEDALLAQKLGCTCLTAGHIFVTACKPGLEPRGLEFLRAVCAAVDVPVYAIGGISPENISAVREAGAAGACVMSGFMAAEDPAALMERLRDGLR